MVLADLHPGTGKVCVITGANSGIGFEAAKTMAKRGYDVILACRSEERGREAEKTIRESIPHANVQFLKLDLASLKSIHQFVDQFHATGKPLNVLFNNAGVSVGKLGRLETEEGYELTFGVNHLGHFLLTKLLLDDLKNTAKGCGEARIIVTTSKLHDPDSVGGRMGLPAHIDFSDVMLDNSDSFDGVLAYKNSKLANVLFTYEIAQRLKGTGVTCNCFHPGFVAETQLLRHFGWSLKVVMFLLTPLLRWYGLATSSQHAAEMMSYLATDADLQGVTGTYFEHFKATQSSKESHDRHTAMKLWNLSEQLVETEHNVVSSEQ